MSHLAARGRSTDTHTTLPLHRNVVNIVGQGSFSAPLRHISFTHGSAVARHNAEANAIEVYLVGTQV